MFIKLSNRFVEQKRKISQSFLVPGCTKRSLDYRVAELNQHYNKIIMKKKTIQSKFKLSVAHITFI